MRSGRVLRHGQLLIAIGIVVFALFPVVWVATASFDPANTLVNQNVLPKHPSLVNFRRLFESDDHPFLLWMWNSVKIATITTVIVVVIGALAAYSFSRFRYRGRHQLLLGLLISQLFPNLLAIVALFLLLNQIGGVAPIFGLDSSGGLILIYSGGALGFNMWLMKGYFDAIPRELDESAVLEGASDLQVFWYVIFPLVRPILVVVGPAGVHRHLLRLPAAPGDVAIERPVHPRPRPLAPDQRLLHDGVGRLRRRRADRDAAGVDRVPDPAAPPGRRAVDRRPEVLRRDVKIRTLTTAVIAANYDWTIVRASPRKGSSDSARPSALPG